MTTYSETQQRRLKELGVSREELERQFASADECSRHYQKLESSLVKAGRERLQQMCRDGGTSRIAMLTAQLSAALIEKGFLEVHTPLVITEEALVKMSIGHDHPLRSQVFQVDKKRYLRPMLAPNLYSVAKDLLRINNGTVRLFEIGSCFRKESQGARHANEFTMLNLVEFGLPEEERRQRLEEYADLVIQCAGVKDAISEVESSDVYGDTFDVVHGPTSLELASGAMGPHPLDDAWRIHSTWVGLGFGLERLVMAGDDKSSMASLSRSLTYCDGIRLNL